MRKSLSFTLAFLIFFSCSESNRSSERQGDQLSYEKLLTKIESNISIARTDSKTIPPREFGDSIFLILEFDTDNKLRKLQYSMLDDSYTRSGYSIFYLDQNGTIKAEFRSDSIVKVFSADSTTQFYRPIDGKFSMYQDTKDSKEEWLKTHHFKNSSKDLEELLKE